MNTFISSNLTEFLALGTPALRTVPVLGGDPVEGGDEGSGFEKYRRLSMWINLLSATMTTFKSSCFCRSPVPQ